MHGSYKAEKRERDWVDRMGIEQSPLFVGKKGGLNEILDNWQKIVHRGVAPDRKSHGYKARGVQPSLDIINGSYKIDYGSNRA